MLLLTDIICDVHQSIITEDNGYKINKKVMLYTNKLSNVRQIGLCTIVWYNADTHKMRIICGKICAFDRCVSDIRIWRVSAVYTQ